MDGQAADKARMRRTVLKQRDQLSVERQIAYSQKISERVLGLAAMLAAQEVFLYIDYRSEVKTQALLAAGLAAGKTMWVPLTIPATSQLQLVKIIDPSQQLAPGYKNIPEPTSAAVAASQGLTPAIDLVILPGSVFDQAGGRCGYGGGYYDRFLATQPAHVLRVGIGYELQRVTAVALASHDQRLDLLVTEKACYWTPGQEEKYEKNRHL